MSSIFLNSKWLFNIEFLKKVYEQIKNEIRKKVITYKNLFKLKFKCYFLLFLDLILDILPLLSDISTEVRLVKPWKSEQVETKVTPS